MWNGKSAPAVHAIHWIGRQVIKKCKSGCYKNGTQNSSQNNIQSLPKKGS